MVFGLFKRKPAPPKDDDPLAVFDAAIASLERQGAEVRKSAATLLALRSALARDRERYEQRIGEKQQKLAQAVDDARAVRTLQRDLLEAQQLLERTREAFAEADANATLLKDAAEGLQQQLGELQAERQGATARLKAGVLVTAALKARAQDFDRLMRLDRARDEVEKARALADLYREDTGEP
jgi:phage shock protein A